MAPSSPGTRSVGRVARRHPIRTQCVRRSIERPMDDTPVTRRPMADRRLPMPPRPLGDEEAASPRCRAHHPAASFCRVLHLGFLPRRPGEASRTPSSWTPFAGPSLPDTWASLPASGGPALLSSRPCVEYRAVPPPHFAGRSAGASTTSPARHRCGESPRDRLPSLHRRAPSPAVGAQGLHPQARRHHGQVAPESAGVRRADDARTSFSFTNTLARASAATPLSTARAC